MVECPPAFFWHFISLLLKDSFAIMGISPGRHGSVYWKTRGAQFDKGFKIGLL